MPRQSDSLETDCSADDVRLALLGVINAWGWDLRDEAPGEMQLVEHRPPNFAHEIRRAKIDEASGEMQLVEYRPASLAQTPWKANIRVRWQSTGDRSVVEIDGCIEGAGPTETRHLCERLGSFRARA